jgi:hypothetical protein
MAIAGQGGLQRRVSGTDRQRDYAKHDLQRATTSTTAAALQSSTDSAAGVAEDADGPLGRAEACPDLVVRPVFPVLDLTVPLVQPASSIATTAAVTKAEPRRVGHMTPVCHRPAHVQVHGDRARPAARRRELMRAGEAVVS